MTSSKKHWNGFELLAFMLLVFTLLRLVFHIYNGELLDLNHANYPLWKVYFGGLCADAVILLAINLPILIALFLTQQFLKLNLLNKLIKTFLLVFNASLIIIATADIPYFRFNSRRATAEVYSLMEHSAGAMPSFLLRYWYLVLLGLLLIWLLFLIVKRLDLARTNNSRFSVITAVASIFLILLIKTEVYNPKNANKYFPSAYIPLVNNTPQTLLYSLFKGKEQLEFKNYMSQEQAEALFSVEHQFDGDALQQKNVILFVLESFSYEYLKPGHPNKAPTPFLDSLMRQSLVFENTYANGATSSYGLMNILGGVPPFLNEPYFSSNYGNNKLFGIGDLLNDYDYTSSFFYGAEDDHYGFRKNMGLLGIHNYFSKEDFKGDAYDGNWGIYDADFFQFAAAQLKAQTKPIFATLFNISSHDPYMVPKAMRKTLPKGTMSSHQSLAYVDFAIHEFFKSIEKETWFENTLFVFIADHWAKRTDLEYKNDVGRYRIPFFIYEPSKPNYQQINSIAQQLDVVPTVLDLLDFDGKWMSFGRSAIGDAPYKITFNEYENIYQVMDSSFVLKYNENIEQSVSLFNYVEDAQLTNNLMQQFPAKTESLENIIKAVIQTYNQRLIDNHLYIYPFE